MSAKEYADDLSATVHYALETTRAVAVWVPCRALGKCTSRLPRRTQQEAAGSRQSLFS